MGGMTPQDGGRPETSTVGPLPGEAPWAQCCSKAVNTMLARSCPPACWGPWLPCLVADEHRRARSRAAPLLWF